MDCSKIHKDIIFFIEGSLAGEKRKAVKEHLLKCEDCSAFADMLKASLNVIDQERKVEEDEAFADRLIERVKTKEAKIISFSGILRYAAAAAVIILGVLSGVNIARVSLEAPEDKVKGLNDETYYLNDMYQEPIESFFLIKYEDNE